jgi:hypothetical protein
VVGFAWSRLKRRRDSFPTRSQMVTYLHGRLRCTSCGTEVRPRMFCNPFLVKMSDPRPNLIRQKRNESTGSPVHLSPGLKRKWWIAKAVIQAVFFEVLGAFPLVRGRPSLLLG